MKKMSLILCGFLFKLLLLENSIALYASEDTFSIDNSFKSSHYLVGSVSFFLNSQQNGTERHHYIKFGNFRYTENARYSYLKCADVTTTVKEAPAFLYGRTLHHTFKSTTSLDCNPYIQQGLAGFPIYKDEIQQYFLKINKSGSERKASRIRVSKSRLETLLVSQALTIRNRAVNDRRIIKNQRI